MSQQPDSSPADAQWFYAKAGQQIGPITPSILSQLISTAQLAPTDLIWRAGMPNWQPAASIPEFTGLFPTSYTAPGTQPTQPHPLGYMAPAELQYGGFWIRFLAAIIDGMIVGIPFTLVQLSVESALGYPEGSPEAAVLSLTFSVVGILVYWPYYAIMESSSWQATLGKRALGLLVTDTYGDRITFARATGRYFAELLSGLILLIGYLIAAFHPRKQALHDLIAGTLVIRGRTTR